MFKKMNWVSSSTKKMSSQKGFVLSTKKNNELSHRLLVKSPKKSKKRMKSGVSKKLLFQSSVREEKLKTLKKQSKRKKIRYEKRKTSKEWIQDENVSVIQNVYRKQSKPESN